MEQESSLLSAGITESPLYNKDLAPIPERERTWGMWNLAALWVGMAVCIPTYLLASYMIKSGLSWVAALVIIGIANLIITIPMMYNGHAGVKYGIPFPVIGRATFGIKGIHLPAIVRGIVACGWFGIQTWIGGLSLYSIFNALTGQQGEPGLNALKFFFFFLFWLLNLYFVWKGTESIRWLEDWGAPILIVFGVALIVWGSVQAGGFGNVLSSSVQLQQPAAVYRVNGEQVALTLNPLKDGNGNVKATAYRLTYPVHGGSREADWAEISGKNLSVTLGAESGIDAAAIAGGAALKVQFRAPSAGGFVSSSLAMAVPASGANTSTMDWLWTYLLWLTAMVGFWATMSISISDITRLAKSQKDQFLGQMLGLPGTMVLYSFVGIFVTCAAVLIFNDILIADDAPWDPVSLIAKFNNPAVVVIAQFFMIIATLTTNIAANVIAPANAFANAFPKSINFKKGGLITGIIGIIICPWWMLNEISNVLVFVSGLLGPVLGVLLCDYFLIRKTELNLVALFNPNGAYAFGGSGYNLKAIAAATAGILIALVGYWVPALDFLYKLSWFGGFFSSAAIYWLLARGKQVS